MARKHTITLFTDPRALNGMGAWMARFTDPSVRDAFDTDTIPTAYAAHVEPARVQAEIQRLNPDAEVLIALKDQPITSCGVCGADFTQGQTCAEDCL